MPTLHSNNPVPSNGSVATVIRGVKSISMTLSGVGAVRAVVQIMAHEDGAAPGPIGNQIVVSGTTTVTTTQTFNAEAGQVYLQLVDITPACKFSATLTELGPIQDTNPGSSASPFTSTAERTAWATANLATLLPGRTTAWVIVGGVAVEYVWNGPLATDWVQGHAGPVAVEYEGIFANQAALDIAIPAGTPGHFATTADGGFFVWRDI